MANEKSSSGISSIDLLLILFITLKLLNITIVAGWSWWWVLAPLWIPFAFAGLVYLVLIIKP